MKKSDKTLILLIYRTVMKQAQTLQKKKEFLRLIPLANAKKFQKFAMKSRHEFCNELLSCITQSDVRDLVVDKVIHPNLFSEDHEIGISGQHLNESCRIAFRCKPKKEEVKECELAIESGFCALRTISAYRNIKQSSSVTTTQGIRVAISVVHNPLESGDHGIEFYYFKIKMSPI